MKFFIIALFLLPQSVSAEEYSCLQLCEIKKWPEIKKQNDFVKEVARFWEEI